MCVQIMCVQIIRTAGLKGQWFFVVDLWHSVCLLHGHLRNLYSKCPVCRPRLLWNTLTVFIKYSVFNTVTLMQSLWRRLYIFFALKIISYSVDTCWIYTWSTPRCSIYSFFLFATFLTHTDHSHQNLILMVLMVIFFFVDKIMVTNG